jgi:hypothetical chaperone protein
MTRRPLAYGVDFGTTNSLIAIAYDDGVEVIQPERNRLTANLRSVVYLHRNGQTAAGEAAVQQYLLTGSQQTTCQNCDLVNWVKGRGITACRDFESRVRACYDSRLLSGIKNYLSDTRFETTHSWARDFSLPDLVQVVLGRLRRVADEASGEQVTRLVLGHPVAFVGTEGRQFQRLQETALDRLVAGARQAGFTEIELLEEPAAAVQDEALAQGLLVSVDFGGGTFDTAVVDFSPEAGEVLALEGAAIGGERFDALLFERFVAPHLKLDQAGLPAGFRQDMQTLDSAMRLLRQPGTSTLIRQYRLDLLEKILYGGHAYAFYRSIEDAKMELSTATEATVELHRPGGVDLSIPMQRSEFEALIAPDLGVIADTIRTALGRADVKPGDVNLVVRTGGSSSIPAFVRMLEGIFHADRVQARDPFTTVVHGLGTYAQQRWAA